LLNGKKHNNSLFLTGHDIAGLARRAVCSGRISRISGFISVYLAVIENIFK
jgi:hypothetical protein